MWEHTTTVFTTLQTHLSQQITNHLFRKSRSSDFSSFIPHPSPLFTRHRAFTNILLEGRHAAPLGEHGGRISTQKPGIGGFFILQACLGLAFFTIVQGASCTRSSHIRGCLWILSLTSSGEGTDRRFGTFLKHQEEYLKATWVKQALVINFSTPRLIDGIRRISL